MIPQSQTTIVEDALPQDPEDGSIFTVADGYTVGGSTVIYVTSVPGDTILGTANQLIPILNVSRRYTLMRVSTKKKIKQGDMINISARQYHYNQMIFMDYYGWMGKESSDKPTVLQKSTYRVAHAIPVGEQTDGYHLYERLCLELIKE